MQTTPDLLDVNDGVDDIEETAEKTNLTSGLESFGTDFPVDAIVKRMVAKDIVVPTFDPDFVSSSDLKGFQRRFIWTKRQADRFIESLLLGFPVPGIFLIRESDNSYLVLDGAQRLQTLESFYSGLFREKKFALSDVSEDFKGRTYTTLEPQFRRQLDNSIIHATIIKRDKTNDLSLYQVFERLNTGGTLLGPQEIRVALYRGTFVQKLRETNKNPSWRTLFGGESPHLKDQELLLRILAMLREPAQYQRPMREFLTNFMKAHQNDSDAALAALFGGLEPALEIVAKHIGKRAFRLEKTVNAALAESVMVGVIRRTEAGLIHSPDALNTAFMNLVGNSKFRAAVSRATADEENVHERLNLSTKEFQQVP